MNPIYKFGLSNQRNNIFTKAGASLNSFVRPEDGTLGFSAYANTTDYLEVTQYIDIATTVPIYGAFYTKNKTYISGFENIPQNGLVSVPKNAFYVRLTVLWNFWNDTKLYSVQETHPIYKDDLSLDYELESGQRFYRPKLSGKLNFVRKDYDLIMSYNFEDICYLYISKSNDNGRTYSIYYSAKFMRTDCTINEDDKIITVQPTTLDQYNDVLAGLEKEYDILKLAPEISRLTLAKRPLIQVYIPGDSIISCFIGGSSFEQDATVIDDETELVETYHFAKTKDFLEVTINAYDTPAPNPNLSGVYSGTATKTDDTHYSGNLTCDAHPEFYLYYERDGDDYNAEIRRRSDDVAFFKGIDTFLPFGRITFEFVEGYSTGDMYSEINQNRIFGLYARYLLDVEKYGDLDTYPLPVDDIVENNRNYKRAIGYALDVFSVSTRLSDEPTEWGRANNGKYYLPPASFIFQKYYPVARTYWINASIWFNYTLFDYILEERGRKEYILRDSYPVASIISKLLSQFAPNIKHEETPEYSQFLYGEQNPITGGKFRLLVTPKSNILVGEYQEPAQKAITTLQDFTNMLKNCFQCYWYIEDNKFKIEHIVWFKNGGSYSGTPLIGYDLTQLENIRNGKKWSFKTSSYTYNKEGMPERYQFKWMDEATEPFDGVPIQIKSNYVQEGKIEDINVSNFTSDVDYMMLNPGAINKDGFALMAAILVDDTYKLPFINTTIGGAEFILQNGIVAMSILQPNFWLYDMPARNVNVNDRDTFARGIQRQKKQTLTFPIGNDDPNPLQLVKTNIGNGQIEKLSINLSSRTSKTTLKYDTE